MGTSILTTKDAKYAKDLQRELTTLIGLSFERSDMVKKLPVPAKIAHDALGARGRGSSLS